MATNLLLLEGINRDDDENLGRPQMATTLLAWNLVALKIRVVEEAKGEIFSIREPIKIRYILLYKLAYLGIQIPSTTLNHFLLLKNKNINWWHQRGLLLGFGRYAF